MNDSFQKIFQQLWIKADITLELLVFDRLHSLSIVEGTFDIKH